MIPTATLTPNQLGELAELVEQLEPNLPPPVRLMRRFAQDQGHAFGEFLELWLEELVGAGVAPEPEHLTPPVAHIYGGMAVDAANAANGYGLAANYWEWRASEYDGQMDYTACIRPRRCIEIESGDDGRWQAQVWHNAGPDAETGRPAMPVFQITMGSTQPPKVWVWWDMVEGEGNRRLDIRTLAMCESVCPELADNAEFARLKELTLASQVQVAE